MRVYYFGCRVRAGHYMWTTTWQTDWNFADKNPWGYKIDSGLCPSGGPQTEGQALLWHKDGWTAISFWDRSVDKRMKSNSNFIAEGTFNFAEMLEIAKNNFPETMNRFKFEIVDCTGA